MNKYFYKNLETIFTSSRLSVYRQDGTDESTALARYLYNIELCRSLYVTLNIFEVSLRNAFDKALSSFAGENWYETLPLRQKSAKNFREDPYSSQQSFPLRADHSLERLGIAA